MMTIACLLALGGFIGTIVSMFGKCPLYIPVLLLSIAQLLSCIPLR